MKNLYHLLMRRIINFYLVNHSSSHFNITTLRISGKLTTERFMIAKFTMIYSIEFDIVSIEIKNTN